jgi:RimJ/RimL family protein N-acetyltransferase
MAKRYQPVGCAQGIRRPAQRVGESILAAMPGHHNQAFQRVRPPLEGRLIRLRAFEEDDVPLVTELFNDPDLLYFIEVVTFPGSAEDTLRHWRESRNDPTGVPFVIETLAGELVGLCDLRAINGRSRTATLGITVYKPYWDRGFGTDAVRTLCRFGFREMNLQRIELHVHETNPRGRRTYEKVGFWEEGRMRRAHFVDGRHVDVIVMGLLDHELVEE